MASPTERKATAADYHWIKLGVDHCIAKLQSSGRKLWYKHLNSETVMAALYGFDLYILDECYLVAYEIASPWYAKDDVLFLSELLVLRLAVSGTDFQVVPAFLERKAREAGCAIAVVGTALAKADKALASLYSRFGFQPETTLLVKEP